MWNYLAEFSDLLCFYPDLYICFVWIYDFSLQSRSLNDPLCIISEFSFPFLTPWYLALGNGPFCLCYELLIRFMYEDSWNLLPLGVLVGECKTLIKHGGFFVKVLYRIMTVTILLVNRFFKSVLVESGNN